MSRSNFIWNAMKLMISVMVYLTGNINELTIIELCNKGRLEKWTG